MTKKELILEAYRSDPNFNRQELSRNLGVDPSFIRKTIRKLRRGEMPTSTQETFTDPNLQESIEFNKTAENAAKLNMSSRTITTLEEALAVAKVDQTEWQVDRYTIGSYQSTLRTEGGPRTITMYKIQVWLKRINIMLVKSLKELVKQLPQIKTERLDKLGEPDGDYLLEIALSDVHFGMLAWGKETQYDYDIDIAEDLYLCAVKDLLAKTKGFPISRILFPFGNDFLHIDDPTNLTPKGHNVLDVDSRLIKIYTKAKKAVIKAIELCRQVAPVDITWVPGNHDPCSSYYLVDVLSHIYAEAPDVTVNISPKWRKFYSWGKCLVCFTHGSEEAIRDLPSIIATEEPILWGNSVYREIHIGHKHKKLELKWTGVETNPGTVIRMIPSIATCDSWSYRKGFIKSWHAAEAYLWDKKTGMTSQITSFVNYDKYVKKDKRTGVPLWKISKE
jgi:hypothetical protein